MGASRTTQRRLRPRTVACGVASVLVVAYVALVSDLSPPRVDRSAPARDLGRCPAARPANLQRRGVVVAGGRPVLAGDPCAAAVDAVDAGYCFGERRLRCLPSFVVAGAQKAATGWLRQWLARHPQLAQGGGKEVHYFDKLGAGELENSWRGRYLDEFRTADLATYAYEKTPDYLPNATAMASLRRLLPSVRLVFMLRAPTGRAYSAYQHHCRKGRFFRPADAGAPLLSLEATAAQLEGATPLQAPCAPDDFHAFVVAGSDGGAAVGTNGASRVLSWGLYAEQLVVVRNLGFADDQLLVILSETAMKQTTKTLDFVVAWLGLEPFDFSALATFEDALGMERLREPGLFGYFKDLYARHNYLMVRRHAAEPLAPETTALLDAWYAPANARLEALLAASDAAVYPRAEGGRLLPPNWS